MRKLIIIPILIVVAIILIFLIYQRQKSNVLPPGVIFSSGTVESNAVTVSAQTAGKVIEKRFHKGDQVETGDTLVLIERDLLDARQNELDASIAATRTDLEATRIDLANVRKNLNRMKEAFQAGSVPQADLDNLTAAYESGGKRVASLEARLELLEVQKQTLHIQLGYTTVTSPISGFVQSDPVKVGEITMAGGALAEIVDLNDTWVEVYINESDIPSIHLNDTADIYLDSDPNKPIKGTVSFISQKAEFTPKNVQTKKERVKQVFAVRIRLDNQLQLFKPGLPVDVYLKKKMSTPAIAVTSLTKSYGPNVALDRLSIEIPAETIFALVGPDGAGKTTLLRTLAGILDFDSGNIAIHGEDYRKDFEAKKAAIGYMPQRFGLYEDLTVKENLDFFADLFSVRRMERQQRIKRLLEFSRLEPFTGRLAGKLSGGMKQKLGLACALIHNPKILLLDEPTVGVDPVSRREFWRLLYDLNREGSTIVVSSSYMDEAERAGHFALLSKGALISHGIPSEEQRKFPYAVYGLVDEKARTIKEQLAGESRFVSVDLFGKGLHITTEQSVSMDEVRSILAREGVVTRTLQQILPTFEDIYINLSRNQQ